MTPFEQFGDRLASSRSKIDRPAINVHLDELIGFTRIEAASETEGVLKCFFAMFQAVDDACLQIMLYVAHHFGPEVFSDAVCPERQRKAGFVKPPLAGIDDKMQLLVLKRKLALVNDKSGVDFFFPRIRLMQRHLKFCRTERRRGRNRR